MQLERSVLFGRYCRSKRLCFRSFLVARMTEVDFHIRGHREGFVFGHLQPAIPRQPSAAGMLEARESDEGRTASNTATGGSIVSNTSSDYY